MTKQEAIEMFKGVNPNVTWDDIQQWFSDTMGELLSNEWTAWDMALAIRNGDFPSALNEDEVLSFVEDYFNEDEVTEYFNK